VDQLTGDCSGWQKRGGLLQEKPRQTQRVYGRSGPDQVPGNSFPTREIYFPEINIPNENMKQM